LGCFQGQSGEIRRQQAPRVRGTPVPQFRLGFGRIDKHGTTGITTRQGLSGQICEKRIIRDHNQVRLCDSAPLMDGRASNAGKGRHRRAAPFRSVQRRILYDKTGVEGR
jgi:hypothetical protein